MPELKIDSLSAGYGDQNVISGITVTLKTGLVIGLSGRNGTGKSTFFKAALGLLEAPHGLVTLDGALLPSRDRWKHIGHLPQEAFIPGALRVGELPEVFLEPGAFQDDLRKNPRFEAVKNSKVRSLSEGERRYLELLLVLGMDRAFFFLDEPFTRIDPLYVEDCRKAILARSATAGILVTDHNHVDLKKVSHRRLVMDQGRIMLNA